MPCPPRLTLSACWAKPTGSDSRRSGRPRPTRQDKLLPRSPSKPFSRRKRDEATDQTKTRSTDPGSPCHADGARRIVVLPDPRPEGEPPKFPQPKGRQG